MTLLGHIALLTAAANEHPDKLNEEVKYLDEAGEVWRAVPDTEVTWDGKNGHFIGMIQYDE